MCCVSYIVIHPSVDCGPPVTPQSGLLDNYTSTTEGSEVFYSCDPGLVPEGRMRAVCTENGWSPNPAYVRCTTGMFSMSEFLVSETLSIQHYIPHQNACIET